MTLRSTAAVTLVTALLAWPAPSAALDPRKAITQYGHDVWQREDGLPQNSVKAILQTRDGYLWLATEEGLARFDGVRFTVFDSTNTPEMRVRFVNALARRRRGRPLDRHHGGGLLRYHQGRFTAYGRASHPVLRVVRGGGGRRRPLAGSAAGRPAALSG